MRFGLDVAQQRMPWDELVRRVQLAEELGFDGAWGFDHFQPMYGDGPGETFEGMTTLAALAGVTTRIRLGLLVTGVTYRHPSVFAAQALTIDHASHGRLELSLGAAWFDKEHDELGIPFPPTRERFALLEDALEIVTRLFTRRRRLLRRQGRVAAATRSCGRRRCSSPTRPSGSAGAARAARSRVARHADVWHAFGTPNSMREASERIDQLAARRAATPPTSWPDRSRSTTSRRPASTGEVARRGLRLPRVRLARCGRCTVERFAREVMPEFTG